LHKILFVVTGGLETFAESRNVRFIQSGVIAGQQDGAAGQSGLDGIQR
jgi:hypothetical protein